MLDSGSIRHIIKEAFGIEDKYLVELTDDWFVPTMDPNNKVGTWIGFMVLSKKRYTRGFESRSAAVLPVRVRFRLTFVGPQAEELVDSTMAWDMRDDIKKLFEKYQAQLNYTDRQSYTYPVKNPGYNDRLCWIVDMTAQTSYDVKINRGPWFPRKR